MIINPLSQILLGKALGVHGLIRLNLTKELLFEFLARFVSGSCFLVEKVNQLLLRQALFRLLLLKSAVLLLNGIKLGHSLLVDFKSILQLCLHF